MKRILISLLVGAISFIVSAYLTDNIIISVGAFLFMSIIVGAIVKGTVEKEVDSQKTGSFWKGVIWLLVVAIIVVAVIAFVGMNK